MRTHIQIADSLSDV